MSSKLITSHFANRKGGHSSKDAVKREGSPEHCHSAMTDEDDQVGEPVNKEMQLLREFDLTLVYGPCTGITRLQRWERAHRHGLNPPQKVKDLVLQNYDDEEYTHCLWKDYAL